MRSGAQSKEWHLDGDAAPGGHLHHGVEGRGGADERESSNLHGEHFL
jgi:hypothetical protein